MNTLRGQLHLTQADLPDDDIPVALSSIIVGAISDKDPRHSLDEVYRAIEATQLTGEIDPLTVVPLLLPSPRDAALQLLNAVAAQTSAKELVIACQEATERLKNELTTASSDEDDDFTDKSKDAELRVSPAQQVSRLLSVYARALPRLRRGKHTPSEIIKPLLHELELMIRFLGQNADVQDGYGLVAAVAQLVLALAPWIAADEEDKPKSSEILYSLAAVTLEICIESISSGVAQRAFEEQFPHLRVPPRQQETSYSIQDSDPAAAVLDALSTSGFTTKDLESRHNIGSLVLLSRIQLYKPSATIVQNFLPVILTSVQTNTALEETLAFLLAALGPLSKVSPRPELSSDITIPLAHVLPGLAGAHPDAPIRHIIFRLFSLILSLTHPMLRFQLLQELLTDTESTSEQMRVAAVGLVKEAVLEALGAPRVSADAQRNIFASPKFMQTFAPIIFRPRLPESGDTDLALKEFLESPEPLRLVEGLGLYYVLLQRDLENRTGIRDFDSMRNIERELLSVLRNHLDSWSNALNAPGAYGDDDHEVLQVGILQMWLERIQSAMSGIIRSKTSESS